jgi:hypothetical protein
MFEMSMPYLILEECSTESGCKAMLLNSVHENAIKKDAKVAVRGANRRLSVPQLCKRERAFGAIFQSY